MTARVAILGAGPAGAGGAYQLARNRKASVTVFEANPVVGGNAGSFEWNGHWLDFGSHRLHPSTDPAILGDIRTLMGEDLLDRPRHGRIRLRGAWIHFPLQPLDLLRHADKGFIAGTLMDVGRKIAGPRRVEGNTFASVLETNLGRTICRDFYFPYAFKIWGHSPDALSAIQARRRVSAGSFGKLLKKISSAVPGFKKPRTGRFFYPKRGFGAITEAYVTGAREAGADFRLGWRVSGLRRHQETWTVVATRGSETAEIVVDYVWSTLPITLLPRLVEPAPPAEIRSVAESMRFRSMILVYLLLPVAQFTEFDAHYFPGADIPITRLSEPKNYAARSEPSTTVLCAELPCSTSDEVWTAPDEALGRLVEGALAMADIPLPVRPTAVLTRRLPYAYPIYLRGYETAFERLDEWTSALPGLLSYGRQGLFAHDNTHHALAMAYAAADCLRDGSFDEARWSAYRKGFEAHVVED